MPKFVILAFILSIFSFSNKATAEMKPLTEILKSEQSPATYLYMAYRCAALSLGWAQLLGNVANNEGEVEKQNAIKRSGDFYKVAIQIIQKSEFNTTPEQAAQNVSDIFDNYNTIWNKNYSNTGRNTGEMTMEDTKACAVFHKSLSE